MHHYGRHGPRAWLKWRRRHTPRHSSRLPVPVKQPVIFHLKIPAEAERVLVVLDYPENERPETTIMEFPSRQLPEPEEYTRIRNIAKRQAEFDTMRLSPVPELVIDCERLEQYARHKAEEVFVTDTSIRDERKEEIIQCYWDTYQQYFSVNGMMTIADEKDRELLALASIDCKNPPSDRLDGRVSYHKEHGYVIRALEVLGLVERGTYERLEEAHDLADKYRFFYRHCEGMVIWPDENTFRGY